MSPEPIPLTDEELEKLVKLFGDPGNRAVQDLLAFCGVKTVAGLIARLVAADPSESTILLTAIRRAIDAAPPQPETN